MQLEDLSLEHEDSFLQMIEDYRKNDAFVLESFFHIKGQWGAKDFQKFAKEAAKLRLDWRPAANKVSLSRYVLVNADGTLLANGLMQFPLTEATEQDGGNLICHVPPALRRKGYGSYCLALMLFEAVRAGLRRVMVTCEADNIAARRMIEKNRGLLTDTIPSPTEGRKGILIARYWIVFA